MMAVFMSRSCNFLRQTICKIPYHQYTNARIIPNAIVSVKICGKNYSSSAVGTDRLDDQPTFVGAHRDLPLLTSRKFFLPAHKPPKQAWLETMSTLDNDILGLLDLHPEVFGVFPRLDILQQNIYWQHMYGYIDYRKVNSRAECPGGGRKPWPQKGSGRARHGSIRSPLWVRGGKSFGPRGPKSFFFMLPENVRIKGLCTALTVKYTQNNLHIVDNLDIPSSEPLYLQNLVETKGWGLSTLFIDHSDLIGRNIAVATNGIKQYNVMPVYGLNVHSLLKHEKVVLTLDALDMIEEKLLTKLHNTDHRDKVYDKTNRH